MATPFPRIAGSPILFRLYLLSKLPSAFFSGVRVARLDADSCVVTVPYKWFTRNPFKSTYFACLAMAAEMSTGLLAMANVYGRRPAVSMLVVHLEANYFKKAIGRTLFTCSDGAVIRGTIEKAIATGEAQTIRARSEGANAGGEPVAEFFVTWSFKMKPIAKKS
ncbi:MAG TPA: PaaI family thioesterase [Puia sp.]|nr:PaaI family thioesterase [Puia sp.]